jgi:hypothetical protein
MCFQATKSTTFLIKPSTLAPSLCHVINSTSDLHMYINISHGIKGKCQSTFCGIDSNPPMYLLVLHLRQIIIVFRLFQKSTHPFV